MRAPKSKKTYNILVTIEIKAHSLKDALNKLEPLTKRKKFKVLKMGYNGMSKK